MKNLLLVLGGLFVSSLAFASEGGDSSSFLALGSALAIGLSVLGGTYAQGRAAEAALSGIARNPSSADKVFHTNDYCSCTNRIPSYHGLHYFFHAFRLISNFDAPSKVKKKSILLQSAFFYSRFKFHVKHKPRYRYQ